MQPFKKHAAAYLVATSFSFSPAIAAPPVLELGIDAADLGTGDPHYAAQRNDRLLADLRNVLAHFYPTADYDRVHDALAELDDIETFAAVVGGALDG